MKYIIRQVKVVDSTSAHNGKTLDLLISNGTIEKIGKSISAPKAKEIKIKGLHVSPGWVDMQANFRDPGHEYKETIASGCEAAMKGGFTRVCLQSSTEPSVDSKSQVKYIIKASLHEPIDIHPIGAISYKREGKELTELFDMSEAGAIAFSDDKRTIENVKLLELGLNYCKNLNKPLIHFPDTPSLSGDGQVNEGDVSVQLGMKGKPSMAEEQCISRDTYILEYTDARLHYNLISTAGSVDLIKSAKKKKLNITSGVAAHQLYFTEDDLSGFDTVHKVNPPYRTSKDAKALIKGLNDGIIDVIVSDHSPEDIEHKNVEFNYARNGIINIQTAFAVANAALGDKINLSDLIDKFTTNPRTILGLPDASIKEGNNAELTFFDPNASFELSLEDNSSLSENSPFFKEELQGIVHGVLTKNKLTLFNS